MPQPRQLINELEFTRIKNAVAAGTSTVLSSAISANGADNFLFGILLGTITATSVTVISVQASLDGITWSDLAGSGVTVVPTTDDNKMILIEVDLPVVAHVSFKVQILRGTANCVVDGIFVCRRGRRLEPVSQGLQVHASSKYLITPPIGAA